MMKKMFFLLCALSFASAPLISSRAYGDDVADSTDETAQQLPEEEAFAEEAELEAALSLSASEKEDLADAEDESSAFLAAEEEVAAEEESACAACLGEDDDRTATEDDEVANHFFA